MHEKPAFNFRPLILLIPLVAVFALAMMLDRPAAAEKGDAAASAVAASSASSSGESSVSSGNGSGEESAETIRSEVDTLVSMLREDANKLDELFGYNSSEGSGGSSSGLAWATFGAVFGIIVREGLEAILIVGAMIAYLVKTKNKRGMIFVYAGAVLALAASVIMAVILYSFASVLYR